MLFSWLNPRCSRVVSCLANFNSSNNVASVTSFVGGALASSANFASWNAASTVAGAD